MRNQRGSIMAYGALAAVIVIGLLLAALWIQSQRLDSAKASLAICAERYNTALEQIGKQNASIESLATERDAAQGRAKAALAAAAKVSARLKPERERLAALAQTFKATGACPAGEAVSEVRKGLRP
jgi:hypothetical protein